MSGLAPSETPCRRELVLQARTKGTNEYRHEVASTRTLELPAALDHTAFETSMRSGSWSIVDVVASRNGCIQAFQHGYAPHRCDAGIVM